MRAIQNLLDRKGNAKIIYSHIKLLFSVVGMDWKVAFILTNSAAFGLCEDYSISCHKILRRRGETMQFLATTHMLPRL
jgi:hypothetical protein